MPHPTVSESHRTHRQATFTHSAKSADIVSHYWSIISPQPPSATDHGRIRNWPRWPHGGETPRWFLFILRVRLLVTITT